MASDEPLLRDLFIQNEYRVVSPEMTMPRVAALFSETPGDALLVYNKADDRFLGCLYLHDFHAAYSGKSQTKNVHKCKINEFMNRNIQEMNWNENVSQAWALVTTKHPHGIILRDDSNKFAGFLSNHDLMAAKHNLDELALTGE